MNAAIIACVTFNLGFSETDWCLYFIKVVSYGILFTFPTNTLSSLDRLFLFLLPWIKMAKFILETNYPSRRVILLSINLKTVSYHEILLPNFILLWMCFHSRLNHLYFDLNCSTVNSLTSISLDSHSFFNASWISSNIFTFYNFFNAKHFSIVAPQRCDYFLYRLDNFREDVRFLICPSQLLVCFSFPFGNYF